MLWWWGERLSWIWGEVKCYSSIQCEVGVSMAGRGTFSCLIVQSLSRVWLFATPWAAHARPPCPSPSPRACSNSCPLSQWCHPTISSPVIPFSSCLQLSLAPGSFPTSWLFASGGQHIWVSALVLPMNIQGWFPLGLAGLIFSYLVLPNSGPI